MIDCSVSVLYNCDNYVAANRNDELLNTDPILLDRKYYSSEICALAFHKKFYVPYRSGMRLPSTGFCEMTVAFQYNAGANFSAICCAIYNVTQIQYPTRRQSVRTYRCRASISTRSGNGGELKFIGASDVPFTNRMRLPTNRT